MSGIDRDSDRSAQVNVAKAKDEVAGVKDNFFYLFDAGETVNAPDELEIAWAPWGVGPHGLHIFLNSQQG